MAKFKRELPCGCIVAVDYDGNARVIYCSKHGAAPDLYDALGSILGYAEERESEILKIGGRAAKWYGEAINKARKALANAEGES